MSLFHTRSLSAWWTGLIAAVAMSLALIVLGMPQQASALSFGKRVEPSEDGIIIYQNPWVNGCSVTKGSVSAGSPGYILNPKRTVECNGSKVMWQVAWGNNFGWSFESDLQEIPRENLLGDGKSNMFARGDRVTTESDNVRMFNAYGELIGRVANEGTEGLITRDGRTMNGVFEGSVWYVWYVEFDSGDKGWVLQNAIDRSLTYLEPAETSSTKFSRGDTVEVIEGGRTIWHATRGRIGTASRGERADVVNGYSNKRSGESAHYWEVRFWDNDLIGWYPEDDLRESSASRTFRNGQWVVIVAPGGTSRGIFLRSEPGDDGGFVANAQLSMRGRVTDSREVEGEQWYRVDFAETQGWIEGIYLESSSASAGEPSVTFSADKHSVVGGEAVMLSWSAQNAQFCTTDQNYPNWNTSVISGRTSGEAEVRPTRQATYSIICRNNYGRVVEEVTVEVSGGAFPVNFNASKRFANKGERITLSWNAPRAESCTTDNNLPRWKPEIVNGRTSGEAVVRPTRTVTFRLQCTGGDSTEVEKSIRIVVSQTTDGQSSDTGGLADATTPDDPGGIGAMSGSGFTRCSLITANRTMPQGFAPPVNLHGSGRAVINVLCHPTDHTARVVVSLDTNEVAYATGFIWRNNWQQISLSPAGDGQYFGGRSWISGRASSDQSFSNQSEAAGETNYALAYTCTWLGDQQGWRCGCRDRSCGQSYWQLQAFRTSALFGGGSGGLSGGSGGGLSGGAMTYSQLRACTSVNVAGRERFYSTACAEARTDLCLINACPYPAVTCQALNMDHLNYNEVDRSKYDITRAQFESFHDSPVCRALRSGSIGGSGGGAQGEGGRDQGVGEVGDVDTNNTGGGYNDADMAET